MLTDDFNRANNADLGANWTPVTFSMGIESNGAKGNTGTSYNWEIWTANTWNANQSSQITIASSALDVGAIVRAGDAAGGGDGYMAMAHKFSSLRRIYRRDNGSFTLLTSFDGALSAGDTIKLDVSGTTLDYILNGGSLGTTTDATYASGSAGVYATGTGGAEIDDWVGTGEIAGGGSSVSPVIDGKLIRGGILLKGLVR